MEAKEAEGMRIELECPRPGTTSLAAGWSAASFLRRRFFSADESAHELSVHLRRDGVNIDAVPGEKFAGVFDAIDARGFEGYLLEASRGKGAAVIGFFKRACDTADPEENVLANLGGNLAARDDVGDSEPPARLENAESIAKDRRLIGRKVDNAVGDDDVHRTVWQRNVLDLPFEEFDVGNAGLAFVFIGERKHFIGHIEAVGSAGGADAAGGEQHVNAAAGAEVEHYFTRTQFGERGGIATTERGEQGFFRDLDDLRGVIEIGRNGIATAAGRSRSGAAAGAPAGGGTQSGFRVFLLHNFLHALLIGLVHSSSLPSLFADADDGFRLHSFVAGTAFGVKKLKEIAECVSVGGVAEKGAFAADTDKLFGFELVQMMRKRGRGNFQLLLDFTSEETIGMGGEK